MFVIDQLILMTAILLLIGIASSKFSARLGLPVLVLFLGVGMLAGSEGLGGIEFENYTIAHGIGSVALAIILFDGGLRTSMSAFRAAFGPSMVLATAGVAITTAVTGIAASYILDISLLHGLLIGSIIGSTDAAAVFSVLRGRGVNLSKRLSATLEVESGANDPMAIFLTVGCLELLLGKATLGPDLLWLFVTQMGLGAVGGVVGGWVAVKLINRIDLDTAGLYPILATATGLLAFGVTAAVGGSGFLAVYLAGIIIGNGKVVFKRGILAYNDTAAWLSQIAMFILLGLLSFPSRLLAVAGSSLLVAAVLILVARPLAIVALLLPFRFRANELTLISWVGLKGAVPIVLATYPLILGLPGAETVFDVVFFVVLVSAILQGWTLAPLARRLGLQQPTEPDAPVTLELTSMKHIDSDIVDYTITDDSRVAGRLVRDLMLPDGAVIAMIVRGQATIPPRGRTRVEAGDHVVLLLQTQVRPLVDRIFGREAVRTGQLPTRTEFPLRGDTTVAGLAEFYDIHLPASADATLEKLLYEHLGRYPEPGDTVCIGTVVLRVHETIDGRAEQVGLSFLPSGEPAQA